MGWIQIPDSRGELQKIFVNNKKLANRQFIILIDIFVSCTFIKKNKYFHFLLSIEYDNSWIITFYSKRKSLNFSGTIFISKSLKKPNPCCWELVLIFLSSIAFSTKLIPRSLEGALLYIFGIHRQCQFGLYDCSASTFAASI